MRCRHCQHELKNVFLDLDTAPLSNAYLTHAQLSQPEPYYPLKLFVCEKCWLVQTEDFAHKSDMFNAEYAYFSSTSTSWLAHAKNYCDMITRRLGLNKDSFVIEVASNDGYLLKNFVAAGIPCLGVEPTSGTAEAARKLGVPVLEEFFGESLGRALMKKGQGADLILGNNVYAHVPDINDFTKGLKTALKPGGTVTLEFPHLMELIANNQFDTVYHEHFSYLSLYTVGRIFAAAELRVFDVEQLTTHGGSLRVYGCHHDDARAISSKVTDILTQEEKSGLRDLSVYLSFQKKADKIRDDFVAYLKKEKAKGKLIAGYGAAAKGNTLMNYARMKGDLVSFVCDAATAKQGKFMPGSHIPILPPSAIAEKKPDIIVIFPWNIADEVKKQLSFVREWNADFVVAVPALHEDPAR